MMPDAHDPSKKHAPMMTTADLALRMDPAYEKISRRFHENPRQFADAFARAWFKLTHRDMGPRARYLGPLVPKEALIWQDPVPPSTTRWSTRRTSPRSRRRSWRRACPFAAGLTAWASASTFRGSATSAAAPTARASASRRRRTGRSTSRPSWPRCCRAGGDPGVQRRATGGKKVSLADLIVLGGCAAVEQAAKKAGHA
jgi:catalase-peroxidase